MLSRKVGKWDINWKETFFYFHLPVGALTDGHHPREKRVGQVGPDRNAQEGGWAGSESRVSRLLRAP